MSQQTIKQRARRQALDVAARHRRERAEREKRLQDLVVQVLTAVGERDAAVAASEQRAGAALRAMTDAEGLTLREAVEWCGEDISVREATRLRAAAATFAAATGSEQAGETVTVEGGGAGAGSTVG